MTMLIVGDFVHMVKVIAVVVTYNRKELLLENITSVLKQIYPIFKIVIIDNNSSDGTEQMLEEKGVLKDNRICYCKLSENLGGAGGFHEGTKVAFQLGADAIWLMDDDGKPANKYTLGELINHIPNSKYYFLNSLVVCSETELSFRLHGTDSVLDIEKFVDNGVVVNEAAPFNGTLISTALVTKIGYPNKDFFIKGDENDYKYRARCVEGCYLATVFDSKYLHPRLEIVQKIFLGKEVNVSVEAPWKEYYRARNYTYMYKTTKSYKAILYELFLVKLYSIYLIGESKKVKTIWYVLRGIVDGMRSKLGKRIQPGQ